MKLIHLFFALSFLLNTYNSIAQNTSHIITYSYPDSVQLNAQLIQKRSAEYVSKKINKLTYFSKKENRQQEKLLKKLAKKESKFLCKLKQKDTLAYQKAITLSYDSIAKTFQETKNGKHLSSAKGTANKTVDSLKKILSFANTSIDRANKMTGKLGNINNSKLDELNGLEQKLDTHQYIDKLIQTRTKDLQGLGNTFGLSANLKGINKQSFYYRQKLEGYKNILNDPSILEEKALSYLQTMNGFEAAMSSQSITHGNQASGKGMQQATNVEDLEKMGFQTKRQVKAQMDKQFGLKTPEQMEQLNTNFKDAQKQVQSVANSKQQVKNEIKKLGFKPNPMRGLPLMQRITKGINWQIIPSQSDNPVILDINAQAGFKHTASLTYTATLGGSVGLGKDLHHLKLSNQGIRMGVNADWKWIWGISGQAGFERQYKEYKITSIKLAENTTANQVITRTKYYRDIAYTGIQKTYKLNSKYNGTILLAYDWLWKKGNASSPIIWRVGWVK